MSENRNQRTARDKLLPFELADRDQILLRLNLNIRENSNIVKTPADCTVS